MNRNLLLILLKKYSVWVEDQPVLQKSGTVTGHAESRYILFYETTAFVVHKNLKRVESLKFIHGRA